MPDTPKVHALPCMHNGERKGPAPQLHERLHEGPGTLIYKPAGRKR